MITACLLRFERYYWRPTVRTYTLKQCRTRRKYKIRTECHDPNKSSKSSRTALTLRPSAHVLVFTFRPLCVTLRMSTVNVFRRCVYLVWVDARSFKMMCRTHKRYGIAKKWIDSRDFVIFISFQFDYPACSSLFHLFLHYLRHLYRQLFLIIEPNATALLHPYEFAHPSDK